MPNGNEMKYKELSKARISNSRNVVISECSKGGFTIAQQLEAKEGDRVTVVFIKGAIHVDNLDGLYGLRDAINLAIESMHKENSNGHLEWDEE